MRRTCYRAFELLAWPAAAWCLLEACLRLALGDPRAAGSALALAACAAATIAASRLRRQSLRSAGA
jgi:hypothetical protein